MITQDKSDRMTANIPAALEWIHAEMDTPTMNVINPNTNKMARNPNRALIPLTIPSVERIFRTLEANNRIAPPTVVINKMEVEAMKARNDQVTRLLVLTDSSNWTTTVNEKPARMLLTNIICLMTSCR